MYVHFELKLRARYEIVLQPIEEQICRVVAKYVGYSLTKFREKILLFRKVTGKILLVHFFLDTLYMFVNYVSFFYVQLTSYLRLA